eukprot:c20017_g2_i3.p1 GENE.c20017_g2_i3~~c20017_g2_i3.p1  ORF type:complete len:120 (-),score=35.73 c20017_g2_i3:96-455(-)
MRRPISSKSSSIMIWIEIQKVLAYVSALITSAILILGTDIVDRWFDLNFDPDTTATILNPSLKIYVMVLLEHFLIFALYLGRRMLPAKPSWLLEKELQEKRSLKQKLNFFESQKKRHKK